jgi:hypothetical protein
MSFEVPSTGLNVVAGRCLSALGVLGLLLVLAARGSDLPGRLGMGISSNAAAWTLGSAVLFLVGIRMLWQASHERTPWKPARGGKRFRSVVVYSRPGCLLCEEALEVLSRYRRWLPPAQEINIDDDPHLRAKFDISVPVVEIDRRLRFRGRVNEVLLQRLIEGTPPMAGRAR